MIGDAYPRRRPMFMVETMSALLQIVVIACR